MWTKQDSGGYRKAGKVVLGIFLMVTVLFTGHSWWQTSRRLEDVAVQCAKLDPEKINLAIVKHYVRGLSGSTITPQDFDGNYTNTYRLYPFTVEEYLKKFPDCCRFYPNEYLQQELPRKWRLKGKCGSVELTSHSYYIKDGQVVFGGSGGMAWTVDANMNFEHISNH